MPTLTVEPVRAAARRARHPPPGPALSSATAAASRSWPDVPAILGRIVASARARVPSEVGDLLDERTRLTDEIAARRAPADAPDSPGSATWSCDAVALLRVDARLRALGPSLDAALAPAFGDPSDPPPEWTMATPGVPDDVAAVAEDAEDWAARAAAPSVWKAVARAGDVAVEVIPVATGMERPFVMAGDPMGPIMHVRPDSPAHVHAHEWGHLVEMAIPVVMRAARAFREWRTGGRPLAPVSQLARAWKPDDAVRPGLADPYWGLDAGPGRDATEVVSGGFGAMQRSPGAFFVADPEHWALTTAILAGEILGARMAESFVENQPRAADGKWTSGGGDPFGAGDFERTRPWDAKSPDDLHDGFVFDLRLRAEAEQRDHPSPHIRVGPKFFNLDAAGKRHVVYHEVGHALSDAGLRDGWAWKVVDDDLMPASGDVNGQTTPGEVVAEAYAIMHGADGREWFARHAPGLGRLVAEKAREHGFPIPGDAK